MYSLTLTTHCLPLHPSSRTHFYTSCPHLISSHSTANLCTLCPQVSSVPCPQIFTASPVHCSSFESPVYSPHWCPYPQLTSAFPSTAHLYIPCPQLTSLAQFTSCTKITPAVISHLTSAPPSQLTSRPPIHNTSLHSLSTIPCFPCSQLITDPCNI